MRNWVSGWSTAQRVVVVVAWAGVLLVGWDWAQRMGGWPFADDGGWFNYAPNSGVVFSGTGPALMLNPGGSRRLSDTNVPIPAGGRRPTSVSSTLQSR